MSIYSLGELSPKIDPDSWIAPNATVIGEVEIAKGASIWWSCTLRGDTDLLSVGENSNIQDNSVLHTDPGIPLVVGKNVTVGHRVILHGCTVGDNSLIGMGSTLLNGAVIGKNCLIGANTLIPEGKVIPDNSLVMGQPGRVVRDRDPAQIAVLQMSAEHYVQNWKRFAAELRPL